MRRSGIFEGAGEGRGINAHPNQKNKNLGGETSKKQLAVIVSAILAISVIAVMPAIAMASSTEQETLWKGCVALEEGTFDATAYNSGESYTIDRTTALGALDAAAEKGDFSYTVNDQWYQYYGALYVDSIADIWPEVTVEDGITYYWGWMYWVNYPEEPMPWVGAEWYDVEGGDVVDWYYGSSWYEGGVWKADTPDTASVLIRTHVVDVEASVTIKPETLNLGSEGVFTVFMKLPEGYSVTDINVSTVECEGASAVRGTVENETFIAKFDRRELVNVTTGDAVTLTVTGELYDGTAFGGSDTIRVIEEGGN